MLAIPSVTLPRLRHGHAGQFGPEPVLDQAGNVLVGATALVMEEDGVTPATIYADRDRTAIAQSPGSRAGRMLSPAISTRNGRNHASAPAASAAAASNAPRRR